MGIYNFQLAYIKVFVPLFCCVILFVVPELHKSAHKNPLIENVPIHVNPEVNETPLTSLI